MYNTKGISIIDIRSISSISYNTIQLLFLPNYKTICRNHLKIRPTGFPNVADKTQQINKSDIISTKLGLHQN